jgi:ATP-dependent protease ClpP protease subunit
MRSTVRLNGEIDDKALHSFLDQHDRVLEKDEALILEVFTVGGDAEVARRIAGEIERSAAAKKEGSRFIGKTCVYSAGVTIMSAFPQKQRFLTPDTFLLIHERRLEKEINLRGPLSSNLAILREAIAQIELGLEFEQKGFSRLIAGSDVTLDEVTRRASANWYVSAAEAVARKLVAGLG